jgi:WD40 repeat protein
MSLDLIGIPDIQVPAAELVPFSPEDGLGCDIAFSDDGRLLAAISGEGTLVVCETAGWAEVCRVTEAVSLHSPRLMWVPGGTVVTIAAADDDTIEQVAFDPRTGDSVEVPAEAGVRRSRTGRVRATFGYDAGIEVLIEDGTGPRRHRPGPDLLFEAVSFTADETRMYAATLDGGVYLLEPPEADRLTKTLRMMPAVATLAVAPDGRHLAVFGVPSADGEEDVIAVVRLEDEVVVASHDLGHDVSTLAWSPDGTTLAALVMRDRDAGGDVEVIRIMTAGGDRVPSQLATQQP